MAAATIIAAALVAAARLSAIAGMLGGNALRLASRGAIGDRWNRRARSAMVVAEICAALVLVVSAGVLVENVRGLQSLDPGFANRWRLPGAPLDPVVISDTSRC